LREVTKKRQEIIEIKQNSTLEDMLTLLIKKYGANFERYVSSGREKKGLQLILLLNEQDISQLTFIEGFHRWSCGEQYPFRFYTHSFFNPIGSHQNESCVI
jgi:hypothetical protein